MAPFFIIILKIAKDKIASKSAFITELIFFGAIKTITVNTSLTSTTN